MRDAPKNRNTQFLASDSSHKPLEHKQLNSPRVMRLREVEFYVQLKHAAIYRKIREGTFPAPIHISAKRVGWLSDEIEGWLEARRTDRDANPNAQSPSYLASLGAARADRD
jgi:prophage regulatory protein